MNKLLTFLALAGFVFLYPGSKESLAQTQYLFLEGSTFTVDGASNRSDFTVEATEFSGWVTASWDENGRLLITGVEFTVVSKQMKSKPGAIMNRLMYKALKASEYENILFVLTSARQVEGESADTLYFETTGELTIAGVTKEIQSVVKSATDDSGNQHFIGAYEMKLTEYGMTPPTALFGALHTRDDMTVHFEIVVAIE